MERSASVLAEHLGIAPASPERAVLRLLVELAAQVVGAAEGSLLVVDRSQDPPRELVFAMTVGSRESERVLVGQRVPIREGVTGLAARTREVQIGAPLYDGVRQAERGDPPVGEPRSVIAAPMLIDDVLVGVITAVSFDPALRFRQEHATLYARAAAVAAVVVDQHRRLEALEAAAAAGTDRTGVERRVLEGVRRLVERRERLPELARFVAALEALGSGEG